MSDNPGKALRQYSEPIRATWLAAMKRGKLKTTEYAHIKYWYSERVPLNLVMQAIERCLTRARSSGRALRTLGVIQADIEALLALRSKSQVGGSRCDDDDWRDQWSESLDELAEMLEANNPELAAMYRELRSMLGALTLQEAKNRYREIHS